MNRRFSALAISLMVFLMSTESCGWIVNPTTVVRINTQCVTKETFDRIVPPSEFSLL